jgi:broad specificity phosphatase PhoE
MKKVLALSVGQMLIVRRVGSPPWKLEGRTLAKKAIQIFAVRHGETTWNRIGKIQGQKNTGLTDLGREQAEDLRDELVEIDFDQVFSSDLRRCRETTDILIQGRDLPIGFSKRFRERGFGKLEGLTWREAQRLYPKAIKPGDVQSKQMPELGIEDEKTTFRDRVLEGIERLCQKYSNAERILLVTHGGVVKVLLREAEGNKTFMVSNCAMFRFEVTGADIKLIRRSPSLSS